MKKFDREDQISLAIWSIDCAERVLGLFERYRPEDDRPHRALQTGRDWVRTGRFRMAAIREASLSAHVAAKDARDDPPASFAAHACGQAVATAHVAQHAYGGAYYALKALAAADPEHAARRLQQELRWQSQRLAEPLRGEVMNRIIVEDRRGRAFISIRKGAGF